VEALVEFARSVRYRPATPCNIRQHTSAYVSMRQHTCQHYVSIRQHMQNVGALVEFARSARYSPATPCILFAALDFLVPKVGYFSTNKTRIFAWLFLLILL
jgi:hypothetical protein